MNEGTRRISGRPPPPRSRIPVAIGAGVAAILRARWRDDVARGRRGPTRSRSPRGRSRSPWSRAAAAMYRPSRTYVGTLEPWVQASVGPQLVSAYVDTVLVRPGATVKRGEVLATLDCRNASAATKAVAMQARAIDAQPEGARGRGGAHRRGCSTAASSRRTRPSRRRAQSAVRSRRSSRRRRPSSRAASLEVNDCVLRAPFDGEVAQRSIDPGAFVRPGTAIVTVVDRSTVRVTADVPEIDFDVVPPGTPVDDPRLRDQPGARRPPSPGARPRPTRPRARCTSRSTSPIPTRAIPVGTTGEVRIDVGEPEPGDRDPARRGDRARREGDASSSSTATSRARRRVAGEGRGRRQRSSSIRRSPPGTPRRHRGARAARGRRRGHRRGRSSAEPPSRRRTGADAAAASRPRPGHAVTGLSLAQPDRHPDGLHRGSSSSRRSSRRA